LQRSVWQPQTPIFSKPVQLSTGREAREAADPHLLITLVSKEETNIDRHALC
jgi:hypothetical protein